MVALRIAKTGKPHTIAESLILPCCKDIVGCLLGERVAMKLNKLPVSNDTVNRRIVDISKDIKNQVISEIKQAPGSNLYYPSRGVNRHISRCSAARIRKICEGF